jgi:hypothetical protein
VCQFRVGSFAFNLSRVTFETSKLYYNGKEDNTVLDYSVKIGNMNENEKIYVWSKIFISKTFFPAMK